MAKKPTPKPIFPIKHEFYASLDAFIHEAMLLHQVAEQLLQLEQVKGPSADILRQRCDAFRAAMSSDPEG